MRPVIDQSTTGLVLKNALDSRDASKKEQQAARWLALAEDVRASTKQALLLALGASEFDIGHTAGLVVAKIAAIEIPKSLWPDLLPGLLEGAAKKDAAGAAGRRQSSSAHPGGGSGSSIMRRFQPSPLRAALRA